MKIPIHSYFESVSRITLGCMGFGGDWDSSHYGSEHVTQMHQALDAALDVGINMFDHADIYRMGKAEQVFAEVLKQRPELRQQIVLQSKCGIRFADENGPGRYDFSADWIRTSVENILKRLGIEQLDILLLHRPDPLMQPEEVAKVFEELLEAGKVKQFGVSNMHHYQMDYLRSHLSMPLVANQLQMSLLNHQWLDEGITAGMASGANTHFSPGTVSYCQLHQIQLQAWGCLANGLFSGGDLTGQPDNYICTAELVSRLAAEYQTSREAIVLGWLMRHPAGIQPIIGTTNPERIKECGKARSLLLSRNHWYELFVSARGYKLP